MPKRKIELTESLIALDYAEPTLLLKKWLRFLKRPVSIKKSQLKTLSLWRPREPFRNGSCALKWPNTLDAETLKSATTGESTVCKDLWIPGDKSTLMRKECSKLWKRLSWGCNILIDILLSYTGPTTLSLDANVRRRLKPIPVALWVLFYKSCLIDARLLLCTNLNFGLSRRTLSTTSLLEYSNMPLATDFATTIWSGFSSLSVKESLRQLTLRVMLFYSETML